MIKHRTFFLMSSQGTLECFCGRTFSQQSAFGNHQRSCKRTKKRLSGVLDKAKEVFAEKKRKISHVASAPTVIAMAPLVQSSAEVEVRTSLNFS
jgi:hypothetical protein